MSDDTGILAELRLELRVRELGGSLSRPISPETYDAIVDFGGKLNRVQVKSTGKFRDSGRGGAYELTCRKGGGRSKQPYDKNDFEILAAYVSPTDTFYLIPIQAIRGETLCLYPHRDNQEGFYEQYKERWDFLSAKPVKRRKK